MDGLRRAVSLGAVLAAAVALASCQAKDRSQSPASQPASAKANGGWDAVKALPDWSGTWESLNLNAVGMKNAVLTPKGQAQWDKLRKLRAANADIPSRSKLCILGGFPGGMSGPQEYTEQFLFTPGQVTMTQVQGFVRRIYTDGRRHHQGPSTLQGDSIGHWEGNTLVVDTINLNSGNEIFYGFPGGKDMHASERMFLKDADTLEIDTVLDAPELFAQPYHYTVLYKRHRDWIPLEMDCAQANYSVDKNGNQRMNLKLAPK